jgi:hypothetical protein
VFAWDDTREGDDLTQTQDIFSAVAQFEAVGSGSGAGWRYAVGGACGLALVGLVLLLISRYRRTPDTPVPASAGRESVGAV